ncbi:MAG: methyltransferase domain-containing protein [Lentisphaerae bacterium]|mgnify:CR=1 FL=1|jgi:SAM-dependent methyltransferase|nr:methyltransferase domain-containing protein [Lentisphaerota bacterium]
MIKIITMNELQRGYWNGMADRYQSEMEISVDDFHYGPQIPGESMLQMLPPFIEGQRALELGCGAAQNSIWLARQGVECVAIDIAAEQLRHAQALAQKHKVKIEFICKPLESALAEVEGTFDFIHSSHALEFVDNPAAIISEAATRLKAGGTLVISTVHPLYNGEWVEGVDDTGGSDGSGLFLRDYFMPPDDIRFDGERVEAVSRAYPVSAWFGWLREAGLEVVHLAEPAAVEDGEATPYTSDDWAHHEGMLHAIPGTVIVVARKRA